MIDAVSLRSTQRGFSLLIGLVLLLGMTILALSLSSSGLFQTRLAYQSQQDVENFQTNDGYLDHFINQWQQGDPSYDVTGAFENASPAAEKIFPLDVPTINVNVSFLEEKSPCDNERAVRQLATSKAKILCRYFDISLVPAQEPVLHRGAVEARVGAMQPNGLAVSVSGLAVSGKAGDS